MAYGYTCMWVAKWKLRKCGRPQIICEDEEALRCLLAAILDVCKVKYRYALPCASTVSKEISLLGEDGKAAGRDFLKRLVRRPASRSPSPEISGQMGAWGFSEFTPITRMASNVTASWFVDSREGSHWPRGLRVRGGHVPAHACSRSLFLITIPSPGRVDIRFRGIAAEK